MTQAFNMDCIEGMRQFPDNFFDLAIVDPPYGIDHAKKAGKMGGQKYGNAASKKRHYLEKEWDSRIPNPEYFLELFRVSKNQMIWGGNYMTENIRPSPCWIVWDKDNGETNFSDVELCWTSFRKGARLIKIPWNGMIQYDMKNKEDRFHPTQKPIKLYRWMLKNYAEPGMKILDTHLGSGSSRIAAHDMGFEFWGYELDKDYFDAQEKRFKLHTSQLTIAL